MKSITDLFECREDCPVCKGMGAVCENHPDKPWGEIPGGCMCGAGDPCPEAKKRELEDDVAELVHHLIISDRQMEDTGAVKHQLREALEKIIDRRIAEAKG